MINQVEDFGFSFHDESEIDEKINTAVSTTERTYAQKLAAVEAIIVPFMQNLMRDPDKVMIKWPNRKEVVEKQLNKILAITKK